jgi:hypothetical protein
MKFEILTIKNKIKSFTLLGRYGMALIIGRDSVTLYNLIESLSNRVQVDKSLLNFPLQACVCECVRSSGT